MKNCMHFNLLKESEHVSSSPVRLRVMLPLLAFLLVVALALWWLFITQRLADATRQRDLLAANIAQQQAAFTVVQTLAAEESEHSAALWQLQRYCNARQRYAQFLQELPACIPPVIQLNELHLPVPTVPPQPPATTTAQAAPKLPPGIPTNTIELITVKVAGRAGGASPSEAVAGLINALNAPERKPFIRKADIPKGAFRHDANQGRNQSEALLFEIACDCGARRFE